MVADANAKFASDVQDPKAAIIIGYEPTEVCLANKFIYVCSGVTILLPSKLYLRFFSMTVQPNQMTYLTLSFQFLIL